jgi:hypothetical protein
MFKIVTSSSGPCISNMSWDQTSLLNETDFVIRDTKPAVGGHVSVLLVNAVWIEIVY